jgi:hypothetical protein
MSLESPTRAERIAARALIHRAEEMGRPIAPDVLATARLVMRNAKAEDARPAQKPIGNPA